MSVANNFAMFLLETARGNDKKREIPEVEAKTFQDNIAEQISKQIDVIRSEQRKAADDTNAITVF